MIAVMIGFYTCGYRKLDRDDRNDRERRMAPGPTAQIRNPSRYENGISALVRSDKATIFARSPEFRFLLDDGKQICGYRSRTAEGELKPLMMSPALDPVDETEDHGEADT